MKRLAPFVVLAVLAPISPTAHAAPVRRPVWRAPGTGVFRQATYEDGEWIYTNGIHQNLACLHMDHRRIGGRRSGGLLGGILRGVLGSLRK